MGFTFFVITQQPSQEPSNTSQTAIDALRVDMAAPHMQLAEAVHTTSPDILQLIQRCQRALCTTILATIFYSDNILHLERPIPIP